MSQGVDINDKHIEVIARQMLRKVAVMDAGESDYLPGRQVNRFEFEDAANALIAEGKEPPVGQPLLLGITKASLSTRTRSCRPPRSRRPRGAHRRRHRARWTI